MSNLAIQYLPIGDLLPYEKNARIHTKQQVEQIAASIAEFGFLNPVLIDADNGIIAGHGRVQAAKKLKMATVPCVEVSTLSEAQKRAYIIADNQLALNAEWDFDLLDMELDALKLADFDVGLIGFDDDFFTEEITEGLTDPDDIPEMPQEPITKLGDIWILGEHRVMCGNSTLIDDIEKLMDGKKADMVFTDPPYGINRDKGFGGFGGFGKPIARRKYVDNWDNDRPGKDFFDQLLTLAEKSLIFGGNYFADLLPQGKHWIVWDKKNTMPTFGDAELIWTNIGRNSIKIKVFEYNGLIGKENDRFHPTQKPISLLAEILDDYSKQNELIIDLFIGSGSTLIACEKINRICYGMELSPSYCDVIVKRWGDYTGKKAILESTGQAFSELASY